MPITQKDINFIQSSNDIRLVIVSFVTNRGPVFEGQIEDWLRMEYNPDHIPTILDYWLPELEAHGEIMERDGMWHAGTVKGELGRPRGWSKKINEVRSVIRMLILESNTTVGHKMIFLAGLPGGGKSTLVARLGIGEQFTNCNIDNFYEEKLAGLSTMDLSQVEKDYWKLKNARDDALESGTELPKEDLDELERLRQLRSDAATMFSKSYSEFVGQVDEVCTIGSNFFIDGTAANQGATLRKKAKYESMGYDCAMIFVDIDIDTSVSRNEARGKKGKRSIANQIIRKQGKNMPANVEPYREAFGINFFFVENRGDLESYHAQIDGIKDGVEAFMRS